MSTELIPPLQRLGQRLAQTRQARGISLNELAERLHMGPEQLRALEDGNREELPEAVFVVAQARRVAASLGVNIDEDIAALRANQAFQARAPQPGPAASAAPPLGPAVRADAPPDSTPSRPPLRLLVIGAALIAATGLAWGLQRSLSGGRPSPPLQPSPASDQASRAAQPQAELVLRSAEPSWVEVRSASGEVLLRGTLKGEQRFPLSSELRVLAGRPDLVSAASGGSPARPLGPIEAVTWYRFSSELSPAGQAAPAP